MNDRLIVRLEDARAEVARLEREAAAASCADVGHRWKLAGGRNCGCEDGGWCSLPVYECSSCGDCDYGDGEEATEIRDACQKARLEEVAAP